MRALLLNPEALGLFVATYIGQFVYLVIGRSAIDNIVVAGYGIIFHPVLQHRRELLFRHPLVIAVLTGLILGLLPLQTITSGFGFLSKPDGRWSKSWQNAKLWIAAPFALLFFVSVAGYISGAPANAPSVWQSFFATSCDLDAANLLAYRYGCANQLIFTATLICALVYSLTALGDRRRTPQDPSLRAPGATGETV